MSRALRVEFDGAVYHVMSRGVGRMRTFADDEDRRAFLELVGGVVQEGGLIAHAFCVMPNHYHLLCETPAGELSRWMRRINGEYSKGFNRRNGRVGHLWQGRYKSILVEDGSYFLECGRYIHLNPNRSRITRPAERYPWSSYRCYVKAGVPRVDWVSTKRTLSHFGGRKDRYRAYVEAGKGEKPVSPFERAYAGLVLGGEAFVERIRRLTETESREDSGAQPALSAMRRLAKAKAEEVEQLVSEQFAGEVPRRQRRLVLYALRKHSRLRPSEIARRCGRTPAAVSLAVRDLDREATENTDLARKLKSLAKAVARSSMNSAENDDKI